MPPKLRKIKFEICTKTEINILLKIFYFIVTIHILLFNLKKFKKSSSKGLMLYQFDYLFGCRFNFHLCPLR